jgi:hypothetical protein
VKALLLAMLSIVITETQGPHELVIDGVTQTYDTHAQCVAAAGATVGERQCKAVTTVKAVGICDTPKPFLDPSELIAEQCPENPLRYMNHISDYVCDTRTQKLVVGWVEMEPRAQACQT